MTHPTGDRQALRKRATRLRILDAAEEVFANRGADEATIQQVANEADVGPATIYQHFASKADLYLAVAERALAQHESEMAVAWASGGSPLDGLVEAAGAYVRFAVTHPILFRLVAGPVASQRVADDMAAVSAIAIERVERLTGSLAQAMAEATAAGALRAVDPERFSRFVWGALSGVLGFAVVQGSREADQQAREALIEGLTWLLDGVVADGYRGADGRVEESVRIHLKAVLTAAMS